MDKLFFNRILFYVFTISIVFSFMNKGISQEYANGEKPDSLLKDLTYPSRFDKISVLDCYKENVIKYYGTGYYTDNGGHLGNSYYTDPTRNVVLNIEWGVDWHVDKVSFSYGDSEDLPDSIKSIKQLPDSAISSQLNSNSGLEGGIILGMQPKHLYQKYGKPKSDMLDKGYRYISYETDYCSTKDVLFYEASFKFRDNRLIRFEIYNGE